MKLKVHYKTFMAIMLFLTAMPTQAQEKITFKTVREYLDYAKRNFGIAPEEVYYVSQNSDAEPPKKISSVMFFQDGRMAVIEDVARAMQSYGSPANMLKNIKRDAIKKSMFEDDLADASFINLLTGKTYEPAKGEMVAVILMGQEMDSVNEDYVKARKTLQKSAGIKTFIVTVDENDITELVRRRE
jgi:spore coat polysaccharide biosynthesis predicted glycosyltransferase SpsG